MLRKTVSGMMLTILSIGMLTLAFNIELVKAEPTIIYVHAQNIGDPSEDGSLEHPFDRIQEGINASNPGDTIYIMAGIYYENILIGWHDAQLGYDNLKIIGESTSTVIDAQGGIGIFINQLDNILIRSVTIRNGHIGVEVGMTNGGPRNLTIEDNIITNNNIGIHFWNDYYATISNNIIEYNNVGLQGLVSEKIISDNIIRSNSQYGIEFWSEWDLRNIVLSGNVITNNGNGGIYMRMTDSRFNSGNIIANNTIANNSIFGLRVEVTYNNVIYHNNFVNNTINAIADEAENQWDNGYPSGGNYWSDYTGVDSNGDGIGDTPYVVDANNVDHYPLMNPYGAPSPPAYALTITTTIGGTTDPAPGTYSYTANSSVQVTAIPNANYLFNHWELDSVNVSANPYSVIMDKDHTLKAVFSPIPAVPVGGYSIPIKGYTTEKPLTLYLALIAILTASFTIAKRRKKQQS